MAGYEAQAPTRIDLAGGTLDIWPLYLFFPGAMTVNVAIDRRASCRVERAASGLRIESLDTGSLSQAHAASELARGTGGTLAAYVLQALGAETGLRVTTESRVPAGSGLGGSSALAVAVAGAVASATGVELPADALWPLVRDAEARCIGIPTGVQDYFAALHGGLLAVHLDAGSIRFERLALDLERVEAHLLLVNAGATRFSGINNWEIFKGCIEDAAGVRACLARIAGVARAMRATLVEGRFGDVAALVDEEWRARQSLAPSVTTLEIDRIVAIARSLGGAGKVCGAGGGGMVALWAAPETHTSLRSALLGAGFECVPFRVARHGLRVEESP